MPYKTGQHVKHGLYGPGTILASDPERTTIDFVEHGSKLFVTSLVRLEPATAAEASPPKRPARRPRTPAARKRRALAKVAAE